MITFNSLYQPYHSNRYCLTARNGMVASSSAIASNAGLEMMKLGGNAVDAAIATAAVLSIAEPTNNGLGGDAFAIIWFNNKMYGLNGSGVAPHQLTIDVLRNMGITKIPEHGWIPVMIPGQPKAWATLIEKFGNLTLNQVLQPAIHYAKSGFSVSPTLAYLWNKYVSKNIQEYQSDPIYNNWIKLFTNHGSPYQFGDIVRFKDQAKTLQLIGDTNAEAFYTGEIADAIVSQSKREGGFIDSSDLAQYNCKWVTPINVNYRGYDVWELPPNGQGLVTLLALNILNQIHLEGKDTADTYHKLIEATKIAFADGMNIITDPSAMRVDTKDYLSSSYGKTRAMEIGKTARIRLPYNPINSGTVYLCTADSHGNMVSYIQSNYHDFGSGIVIGGYGISMQNRGFDFSMDPSNVNCLAPGKRTYHTIIPGFLTERNKAIGPFGVMGGYMQPQGHIQVLTNMIDFHLNPQMALDAPRWQWIKKNEIKVEPEFSPSIAKELCNMGHEIEYTTNRYSFGRGQIIQRLDNGVLIGGTESRTDSNIACY